MLKEEMLRKPLALKIFGLLLLALGCFYLGKHWASGYEQVIIAGNAPGSLRLPAVALAPNQTRTYDLSALHINATDARTHPVTPPPLPTPLLPPPPPSSFGVVREDGSMRNDFKIGDSDNDGDRDNDSSESEMDLADQALNGSDSVRKGDSGGTTGMSNKIQKFKTCPANMTDYIPCLDNIDAINRLPSTSNGEKFERHCPDSSSRWCHLIPAPPHYQRSIAWPKSRDEDIHTKQAKLRRGNPGNHVTIS